MAFVRLMCKAAELENRKLELYQEKQFAIQKAKSEAKQKKSLKLRYRHCWLDCMRKIRKFFRRRFTFPEKSRIFRCCYKMRHEGSCENYTLKSVIGFIGGFLITYIFFMFFVFQLNFKFSTATIMCSIFGSILTIGLAFSYKVRCVVFLTLPQLFSKRGRQALLAYAFILAITGPAKNTLNNMGILSESLACGQEQLKAAVKQILEVIKKPFYAIRDAIKAVVKVVKIVVKKIKEILLAIKRVIMAIVAVIKSVFEFLAKIINVCNKELGTPFQRCTRVFESAITDCHAKLGPVFSWLCSITYLAQSVCYIVKIFDYVCMLVDFISNSIIGVVVKKIRIFVRHIKTMFYVRIKFSHSFHFETNASKSLEDVATGIVTEIKERTEGLMKVFDFMSCATSLFFMFIVFRVLYYRYKFLSDERFDNRFITKDFRAIDMRRAQLGKETVLPLNQRERNMYISVGSCRLVKKEKLQLSQSAMVLGTASLKLATHMMADYALFWVLLQIRRHGSFQSTFTGSNIPTLHVKGEGFLADLLRSIVKAFQPVGLNLEIDTIPCLPDPIPPDYDRYVQIASLLVICWFLMLFEPFGLRWRHSVMCFYHPHRAKERSIWLYNHILRTRSSFLKFARRQLRRKFKCDPSIAKITCKEFVKANLLRYRLCRLCLSQDKQMCCLLCGEVFREGDAIKPIRCQTPNCPGIYCEKCFQDLQNLCTVCLDPIQYGDLSDISEEKDSSDLESGRTVPGKESTSEDETVEGRKKKKLKLMWCCRKKRPPTEDESDDSDTEPLLETKSPTTISTPPTSDSDYYSTDTDLSYSYQYKKDVTEKAVEPPRRIFVDIEKQRYPDYASMDTFRESTPEGQTLVKSKERLAPESSESSEPQFEHDGKFDIPLLDLRSITDQSATTSSETPGIQADEPTVIDESDQPKQAKRGYLFRRKFWKKKKKAAEKTGKTPLMKDVTTSTETLSSGEETVSEPTSSFHHGEGKVSSETSAETSPEMSSGEGDSETKLLSQPSEEATTTTPSTAETPSLLPEESTSEVPGTTKIPLIKKHKSKFAEKEKSPLKRKEILKETTPWPKEEISTETTTTTETPVTGEIKKVKRVSKKPSPKEETTTTTLTPLLEETDNKVSSKETPSEQDISEETTTTTKTSESKESLSEENIPEEITTTTKTASIEESEEIRKLPKKETSEETPTTTTETLLAEDSTTESVTKEALPEILEETTTTETPVTQQTKKKGILKHGKIYFDESITTETYSTEEQPKHKSNFMERFLGRKKAPKSPLKSAQKELDETRKGSTKEKVSESAQTEDTWSDASPERITKGDQKEEKEHDVNKAKNKIETEKTKRLRKSLRKKSGKLDINADMPEEDEGEILRKKKKRKGKHRKKTDRKTQTETKPQFTHVAQLCAEILKRRAQRGGKKMSTEIYCMNETCPVKLKRGKVPKLNLGVSPRKRRRVKKPHSTSSTTPFTSSTTESDTSSVASKTSLNIPSKKRDKVKKKKENAKSKRRGLHRELSELDLSFAHQDQEPYHRKYDVYYFTESETTPRSNKGSVRSVTFSPVPKLFKRPKPKVDNSFNVSPGVTSSTTTSSSATSVTILTSPNSQTVKSQTSTTQGSPHYTINYLYSDDFKESDHQNVIQRKNRRSEINALDSPGNTTGTDVNANSYKNKARNYYSKLKTKPIDNPTAPGDHQSKFGQFIRRLLRKN